MDLHLVCTSLAAVDNFHGPVDNLVVEVPSQPALEEADMDEGAVEEHVVAPDGGVGRPPCLQLKSCLVSKAKLLCLMQHHANLLCLMVGLLHSMQQKPSKISTTGFQFYASLQNS